MNGASRPTSTGKTRTCPHCKATILESLSICPGCLHHLRFDQEAAKRQVAAAPALRVEGIIRHPPLEAPLEYFVVIGVRNDRGEEVTRQVVNVGALQSGEKRTFSLSVEVLPLQAPVQAKPPATVSPQSATIRPPAVVSQDPQASPGNSGTYKVPTGTGAPKSPPGTVQTSARIRPSPQAGAPQPQTIPKSPAQTPVTSGSLNSGTTKPAPGSPAAPADPPKLTPNNPPASTPDGRKRH